MTSWEDGLEREDGISTNLAPAKKLRRESISDAVLVFAEYIYSI